MKKITIRGKNNIHKCLKANLDESADKYRIRDGMKELNEEVMTHSKQFDMIRQLYTGGVAPSPPTKSEIPLPLTTKSASVEQIDDSHTVLTRELEKKISGYKGQDVKKDLYNKDDLITFDEVVEKLVASKLKCYYCSCQILLLYKNVREPTQWTLDRKDNELGHTSNNTMIACLKCNLQRRVTTMGKFDFTKKLILKKQL